MYKTLTVAALLLAAFAFTSGSRSADASPTAAIGPAIVAKGKLVNQTATIPATAIFTPSQNGLYRLSAYATLITGTCGGSTWSYTPEWTDDSGVLSSAYVLQSNNSCPGSFVSFTSSNYQIGATITFEAKGGTAIDYSVSQIGSPDGTAYSLYYTLERLE